VAWNKVALRVPGRGRVSEREKVKEGGKKLYNQTGRVTMGHVRVNIVTAEKCCKCYIF
jgi:hypothetical protein